jgi:hypothetical protein
MADAYRREQAQGLADILEILDDAAAPGVLDAGGRLTADAEAAIRESAGWFNQQYTRAQETREHYPEDLVTEKRETDWTSPGEAHERVSRLKDWEERRVFSGVRLGGRSTTAKNKLHIWGSVFAAEVNAAVHNIRVLERLPPQDGQVDPINNATPAAAAVQQFLHLVDMGFEREPYGVEHFDVYAYRRPAMLSTPLELQWKQTLKKLKGALLALTRQRNAHEADALLAAFRLEKVQALALLAAAPAVAGPATAARLQSMRGVLSRRHDKTRGDASSIRSRL